MAMGGHMKNTVLNHMPQSFQSLVYQSSASTTKDMVPKPQLDAHVFCQVNEDLGSVDLDNDGETVEFNKGDLFVVRYKPVRHLVDTGKVQLV